MIDPFRFGPWVSAEAIDRFRADAGIPLAPQGIEAVRAHYDTFNRQHLAAALEAYEVEISEGEICGVKVQKVSAPRPVGEQVLICLHGGAFMWGRGAGALLEAVPMASVSGMTVVAVEYALAPEKLYPAATLSTAHAVCKAVLRSSTSERHEGIQQR